VGVIMASLEQGQKFCVDCDKDILVQRKGINHLLHLILTIVTAGWWLLVWIFLILLKTFGMGANWKCSSCGGESLMMDSKSKEALNVVLSDMKKSMKELGVFMIAVPALIGAFFTVMEVFEHFTKVDRTFYTGESMNAGEYMTGLPFFKFMDEGTGWVEDLPGRKDRTNFKFSIGGPLPRFKDANMVELLFEPKFNPDPCIFDNATYPDSFICRFDGKMIRFRKDVDKTPFYELLK
jgi:hypothetical protein